MKVEIWSDVACPWCYIGKRRFETALARFDGAPGVEVRWRSFQLDPTHPKGVRAPHDESLATKLGVTAEQVQAMNARLVALAAGEGLDYHFERYQVVNTFDAHRVAHLGAAHGLGAEMHERLLRAQLVEGGLLDDPETLVRLAVDVGIAEVAARAAVETDAYSAEVAEDIREAQALGVRGVPFFAFDRRFGVSGAQASEVVLRALTMAADGAGS